MSERRERDGKGADLLGLVLFGGGAFVLALVVISFWRPFPAEGTRGTAALAAGVVGAVGRVPAAFLSLVFALLGAHRFLQGARPRLGLNLLGTLGMTAGLAVLCGAAAAGAGGSVGAATGGALGRVSPVLGVVAGLLIAGGSAWLIWLRELLPLPGAGEVRRAFSRPGRERASDGVSAAEAEALVVPGRPAAPRASGTRPLAAPRVRPIPNEDSEGSEDSDGTTPSDPAPQALPRGKAPEPQDPALQSPVADLAGAPAPAHLRGGSSPGAAAAVPADAPATDRAPVTPLARPLSGVPPLGLAGGAQALTRPPAPPRPSWERLDEDTQDELAAEAASPHHWRPARRGSTGQGAVAVPEADEVGRLEPEEARGDSEVSELEGEPVGEGSEDGELDEIAGGYDDEVGYEDEDQDEDEEEEEDEDSDGDEDASWEDEVEDEEDEEDEEELEEDAAELEDWEEEAEDSEEEDSEEDDSEEEELAAELDEPRGDGASEEEEPEPEVRPRSGAAAAGAEVEAELRRLLDEEDARGAGREPASPAQAAPQGAGKAAAEGRDVLQMELFAGRRGSMGSDSPDPAPGQDGPGAVLAPQPPSGDPRRKPVRTRTEAPAPPATRASTPSQLVVDCGCLFLDRGRVAVSMLQKTFDLDFEQSCAVLDELQERGLVGPYLGGQRRDILLTREQWLELVGQPSQVSKD